MSMYKHYIIYQITNLVNNKIYIGKHKCDELDDEYFGSGKRLWLAINKYRLKNFKFDLLIDLHSQDEMDLLEECVVNSEFLKRDDVYNISRGGKNPCMYGKKNPFYGKTHTKELKQRLSKRFKGTTISDAHKKKISDGLRKMIYEHPEVRCKFASRKGKKQCLNINNGDIKFFAIDDIPDDFELYRVVKTPIYVSKEKKEQNKKELIERNHKSKWFNNGVEETFCLPENAPTGFISGRLPTINIGRVLSDETKKKMSESTKGKTPINKGKVWITNGVENQYVSKDAILLEGWRYGMTRKKKD